MRMGVDESEYKKKKKKICCLSDLMNGTLTVYIGPRMDHLHPSVRRFLDLEAGIDSDEERNSEQEEEEEEEALRSASSLFTAYKR